MPRLRPRGGHRPGAEKNFGQDSDQKNTEASRNLSKYRTGKHLKKSPIADNLLRYKLLCRLSIFLKNFPLFLHTRYYI